MSNLTLAELNQTITDLTVVYYGTSDTCPKGEYFMVLETEWSPPFIIVHPDDLDTLRQIAYPAQLVHLSQETYESRRNRLSRPIRHPELEDPYKDLYRFNWSHRWSI